MSDQPKKLSRRSVISIALILIGALCVGYYIWQVSSVPEVTPPASSVPVSSAPPSSVSEPESSVPEDPTAQYPAGKLFITHERDAFVDGAMTLTVPRLELDHIPVLGAVDDKTLEGGVGLYDYAQMPGTGNRNVSIAGHRDVFGMEFYNLDKLVDGDEMFLTWGDKEYVYRYKDIKVVEADDWTPIHIQGFSCLTLTTCTPINVASHRLIARAELLEIRDAPSASSASASSAVSAAA